MEESRVLTPALERGLRRLRLLQSCELSGDPSVDAVERKWIQPVVLEIEKATEFVPRRSRWVALVADTYPLGPIDFYPSANDSISVTFPHQERNARGPVERPWRDGKLCLDSPFRGERFSTQVRDPVGDAEERLAWHARRALAWLEAAAAGDLLARGDPFELPSHPAAGSSANGPSRIVYDESHASFAAWQRVNARLGTAVLSTIPGISGINVPLAVVGFFDTNDRPITEWSGRTADGTPDSGFSAVWWRWPSPVVLAPWQAPMTWGELRQAGKTVDIDVDAVLREIAKSVRGSERRALLLVGYPIPARIGHEPSELHWDTVLLPPLAAGGKAPPGFRENELGWWARDRRSAFGDQAEMQYVRTENWSEDRLRARGGLLDRARSTKVAMIGLGAFGSLLAELLVRTGVKYLALFDGEKLTAGNICRHTATLDDVGTDKVDVARRLKQISPHVEVVTHATGLPASPEAAAEALEHYDAILDCTASANALMTLGRAWWAVPRLFVSASVGYGARRLFLFATFGNEFPSAAFDADIRPWLEQEASAWANHGELLEGPGCWSPLFPARHDDLALAAAVCLKEIESWVQKRPSGPVLHVFEQAAGDDGFRSFARISEATPGDEAGGE